MRPLIPALVAASAVLSLVVACGTRCPPPPADAQSAATNGAGAGADSSAKAVNNGQCPKTSLLDDLEDGNNKSVEADMRGGYWYTYVDKAGSTVEPTGNFTPAPGGANGSQFAARMHGKLGGGSTLYAGMGFSFTDPKSAYDISCCKGISFWAKKDGAGTGNVRFKVGDAFTSPEGGVCKTCYNDFGADYNLTNDWKQYTINFADMRQESGWGEIRQKIDSTRVFQLQWQVKDPGQDFDIWVDQVELTGCSG
jgi:endoglucanase